MGSRPSDVHNEWLTLHTGQRFWWIGKPTRGFVCDHDFCGINTSELNNVVSNKLRRRNHKLRFPHSSLHDIFIHALLESEQQPIFGWIGKSYSGEVMHGRNSFAAVPNWLLGKCKVDQVRSQVLDLLP